MRIRGNAGEYWEYGRFWKIGYYWIICEIGIFGYELHGIDEIAYNCKFVIEAN